MRRREKPAHPTNTPPAKLMHYNPSDWPEAECHPECAYWEAWQRWDEKHPDYDTPLETIINGPDTPWHPELI